MPTCLENVVVLELGERLAVRLCGSLLAQLGATVVTTAMGEAGGVSGAAGTAETVCAAGKLRLAAAEEAADHALLAAIARRADVVLASSDDGARASGNPKLEYDPAAVVCDISAYGTSGPLSGLAHADALVQATSGLLDTTGDPSEPPIPIGVPITEFLGAINAATGVLATLRLQRRTGHGYPVEIALYDCAFETLSTFLARALAGQSPTRVGNRHPNVSPFNTYRARDGLLSLCTGNDEHWRRVCKIIGRDDAALDPDLATGNGRASRMDRVDAMIAAWTIDHSVEECIERFLSSGIPAGPVTPVASVRADADFAARGVIRQVSAPEAQRQLAIPGSIFAFSAADVRRPETISRPADDRIALETLAGSARPERARPRRSEAASPLAGVRVVEIGQYTTGPRAARHLAALGADVIKIEMPPLGDPARAYAPLRDGQSYFFHLNNSGKQTLVLDLKLPNGARDLSSLLAQSDVLIENLKPGALAKLGFASETVLRDHPGLVYCSVSGYGRKSVYRGRPGMDSVIQGMAGLMDATRSRGNPYKGGISISDVAGGQIAVLAIIAALEFRDRTGEGQFVDVSMLDVSAWLTHLAWNPPQAEPCAIVRIVRCSDGCVAAIADDRTFAGICAAMDLANEGCDRTRLQLVGYLSEHGIPAAAVNTVPEALVHPQTVARGLVVHGRDPGRPAWPHVASPIRIGGVPGVEMTAAGRLHDHQASLIDRFGLPSRECASRDASRAALAAGSP